MRSPGDFTRILLPLTLCAAFAMSPRADAEPNGDDVKPIPVGEVNRSAPVDFEKEVLPILSTSCLACHNRSKAKAKLVLETPADIRKGGESGPAAVPGKGLESLLVKAAAHAADVDSPMPPPHNPANAPDLNSAQLGLIRLWIDQGANGEVRGTSAAPKWVTLAPGVQPIYAVAATGDGQFAACGRGNRIDVYNLPTGRLVAHLTDPRLSGPAPAAAHRDLVESLAFSPDGSVLASGSYREIKLWRRPTAVKKFDMAGLGEATQCAAVSPDSNLIAVGDADGKIRLFDSSDGKASGELTGHDAAVTALCISPDGKRLISVSTDTTARVWDLHARSLLFSIETPCELRAVAWVDGGRRFAAAGADGIIRLWTVPDSDGAVIRPAAELKGHEGGINALAVFPSMDKQLLSGGEDGTVRIWNVDSGRVLREAKHGSAVVAVAVSRDGKRFASAGLDNAIRVWNGQDAKQLAEAKGDPALLASSVNAERALSLAAAEIGYCKVRVSVAEKDEKAQADRLHKAKTALAAADSDILTGQHAVDSAKASRDSVDAQIAARKQTAEALTRAEELLTSLQASLASDKGAENAKAQELSQVAAAADSLKKAVAALSAVKLDERRKAAETALAKATADVKKSTVARAAAVQEATAAGQTADAAARQISHAKEILKAAESARVQHETAVTSAKQAYARSARPIRSVEFSPDGLMLAAAGDDGIIRTLYPETGAPRETITHHLPALCSVTFIGNNALLAIDRGGRTASAWDISCPWKLERTLGSADGPSPIADRVTSLDFSPDGNILASGGGIPSRGGEVKLWDLTTSNAPRSFDEVHVDTVTCVRFSPDGNRLACASADRFVRLIDPNTGKVALSLEGHQHHVLGVAWRRDGHTIASAGADNTLRFWNPDTGERTAVVTAFDKEVTAVCFLGNTNLALATSGDGRVRAYNDDGSEDRSFAGPTGFVYAASVTPDGATVLAGGEDGILRTWNAQTSRPIAEFKPQESSAAVGTR